MRMNDQDYFRSCIARERQLAHLLGHQHIEECYESAGTLWDDAQALPKWTRDWGACGPLMAAHGISVEFGSDPAHSDKAFVRAGSTRVYVEDHPTRDRAVMYAVVKELIVLLEHANLHKAARPAAALQAL